MTWTKKHAEFCLRQKLRPSTTLLTQFILRRSNNYQVEEIELDLRVFNSWVAKARGRGFDRKTLREAIRQLDEQTEGLIMVTKDYSPWIKKVLVRPLKMVLEQNSRTKVKTPKLKTGDPMFDEQHKKTRKLQQQQNISKLDTFLRKVGLNYTPDNLMRIWRLAGRSWSEMTTAVEYLLHSHSTQTEGVRKPHGFLVESLKCGWHKGFDTYYQCQLPFFRSGSEISTFVKSAVLSSS